ncbi:MAG: hypothetical protein P4L11_03180 [Geothrix sp.]|nr:hypothetical protein [Geothrix sp.]
MAVPVLHLNLAPRPSLWRQRHVALGWAGLGVGLLFLAGAIGFTWRAYHQAGRAGREAVGLTEEARRAAQQEQQIRDSLQDMDASREQSRWKLAERILQERSLPWSRLTAELEQCMVPDMRLKGLQRARGNAQQVVLKLRGEARTRQAEAAFVEALRATPVFAQVILERESERAGGGWDFEISLPTAAVPPPFQVKAIQLGPATPAPAVSTAARPAGLPGRTPPAPAHPASPAPRPAPTAVAPPPAPTPQGQHEGAQVRPALPPTVPVEDDGAPGRRKRPPRSRPIPSKDPE